MGFVPTGGAFEVSTSMIQVHLISRYCMCSLWTPEHQSIDMLSDLCLALELFSLCIAVAAFSQHVLCIISKCEVWEYGCLSKWRWKILQPHPLLNTPIYYVTHPHICHTYFLALPFLICLLQSWLISYGNNFDLYLKCVQNGLLCRLCNV